MNFLAIDTTMEQLSVAACINGKEKAQVIDTNAKKHNSVLFSEIDILLKQLDSSIKDIDIFGVVTGPGSFTGIRIGVAAVNAFCLALNKKVVEITALELAAYNHDDILAMIDCKHNNYYAALVSKGEITYIAINGEQAAQYKVNHILYKEPDSDALLNVMKQKIKDNKYTEKAKPFYMKKSSAERENEF